MSVPRTNGRLKIMALIIYTNKEKIQVIQIILNILISYLTETYLYNYLHTKYVLTNLYSLLARFRKWLGKCKSL